MVCMGSNTSSQLSRSQYQHNGLLVQFNLVEHAVIFFCGHGVILRRLWPPPAPCMLAWTRLTRPHHHCSKPYLRSPPCPVSRPPFRGRGPNSRIISLLYRGQRQACIRPSISGSDTDCQQLRLQHACTRGTTYPERMIFPRLLHRH